MIACPRMAGQMGPKASMTKTRESTGQETRLDQMTLEAKDLFNTRKKSQSRLSETKKAAIEASAISRLKKRVMAEAASIQPQVAQSPQ